MAERINFWLEGENIAFIAEAPEDITLKQLIKQCDKIKPRWGTCGIEAISEYETNLETEIVFTYDSVRKTNEDVLCEIVE